MLKSLFGGFVTAFSMYSAIPMPQIEWTKDTMKYALCFFPLVGALIGGVSYAWIRLCLWLHFSPLLFAAGLTLLPVLLSGGIHIDGLMDTGDARGSHLDREKKLAILKDPHIGAFGVITCVCYFVAMLGLSGQLYQNTSLVPLVCLSYVLSRACSGFAIVTFPTAKNSGLAYMFADGAQKKAVRIVSVLYVLLVLAGMIVIHIPVGIVSAVLVLGYFGWFYRICVKQFGGLTGDLAGFFLCMAELIVLICAALGGLIG